MSEDFKEVKTHPDYNRNLKRALVMCSPPDERIYTFRIVICSSQWGYEDLVSVTHRIKDGLAYAIQISLHQSFRFFSKAFYDAIYNGLRLYLDDNQKIGRKNAHLDDEALTDDANAWFLKICWYFTKIRLSCRKIGKSVAEFERENKGHKNIPTIEYLKLRNA